MNNKQKLVALCALLPVIGDWIEDLEGNRVFKHGLKNKSNLLLAEITRVDREILDFNDDNRQEVFNQQIDLQRSFIQFIDKQIKFD
jgi:hypothetical protein